MLPFTGGNASFSALITLWTGWLVVHGAAVVQLGVGSPPPLDTTLLPTEPLAFAFTVAV
ncbi:MAG: hypothetical protein IAE66_08865 [Xanthomonadaceae bacterium]|nr:hypothetical protein [Xanthomonadaceae bacterium]